ncbi:MAG: glycosyltransferase, partial [Rhizobacter sp.]|nr:glycosyltransferase [Rhizobacter sp.]
WLGQQPYALLPQLVAGWDVCLMPFAINESTEFISPTKTLEYMAAGKPIVSTPIHDVRAMFGDLVTIAADTNAFVAGCRAALAESVDARAAREQRMLARVREHSWDAAAAKVRDALAAALAAAASAKAAGANARTTNTCGDDATSLRKVASAG